MTPADESPNAGRCPWRGPGLKVGSRGLCRGAGWNLKSISSESQVTLAPSGSPLAACPVKSVDVTGWDQTKNTTSPVGIQSRVTSATGGRVEPFKMQALKSAASGCKDPVSSKQVTVEVGSGPAGSGSAGAGSGAGKVIAATVTFKLSSIKITVSGKTITITGEVQTVNTKEGAPKSSAPTVGWNRVTNVSNTTM